MDPGRWKHHMDKEGKFYVAEKAVLIFLWKIFNSHQRPWILQQLPTNSEGSLAGFLVGHWWSFFGWIQEHPAGMWVPHRTPALSAWSYPGNLRSLTCPHHPDPLLAGWAGGFIPPLSGWRPQGIITSLVAGIRESGEMVVNWKRISKWNY